MLILFNVNNFKDFVKFLYLYTLKNMFSFKPSMRKYLILIYLSLSIMSFAQFKENAFDNEQSKVSQENAVNQTSAFEEEPTTASALPPGGEQPEGPGNPGEPVPINGFVPVLLLTGIMLAIYYQRKKNKINI